MADLATTDALFFERTGLDRARLERTLRDALAGADDGELFFEYRQSEGLAFDDGRLRTASFDTSQGFGLRAVAGETTGYAHAAEISEAAIARAAQTVKAVRTGRGGIAAEGPAATNAALYAADNPLGEITFEAKVKLLQDIDAYARARDSRVTQVVASIAGEWQAIQIIRADGRRSADIRPARQDQRLPSWAAEGDRMETGSHGAGGRTAYGAYLAEDAWKAQVDEALRQALANLESVPAPAGEMPVVLGPGWPGILLHEAIGHGLEGDFNRKKTSAFAGLLGERIAAPGVTVVDDGTIADRRGSLSVDDEGTPSQKDDTDRRRHPDRLHAGSAERPADGPCAHRQRTAGKLCPRADAADDQTPTCCRARTPPRRSSPRSPRGCMRSISAAARSTSPPASSSSRPRRPIWSRTAASVRRSRAQTLIGKRTGRADPDPHDR